MQDVKKKLENIWYYYKAPIIIVGAIIIISLSYLFDYKEEIKYDHSVALISVNVPSEQQIADITKAFENEYGGSFEIKIYNVALTEEGQDQVIISKLDLDLGNKLSEYLLIEDLDAFKKATNNLEIHDVALVSNIDFLKGFGIDNLYFAKR